MHKYTILTILMAVLLATLKKYIMFSSKVSTKIKIVWENRPFHTTPAYKMTAEYVKRIYLLSRINNSV